MEQVSRPPGKSRGRAGPGAPWPPPPLGCSEGGRAVPEAGGGRSGRKPGPSRGRGCWGGEGGRREEGASSALPESAADSDIGWASRGGGWEAREPGEGPGSQECAGGRGLEGAAQLRSPWETTQQGPRPAARP